MRTKAIRLALAAAAVLHAISVAEGSQSKLVRKRISCRSCRPPECSGSGSCSGAVRCYSAHVRDVHGNVSRSKGCTRDVQQTMLYCGTASHDGRQVHERNLRSGQYAFRCCAGDMCNDDDDGWPELPDVPEVLEDSGVDEAASAPNSSSGLVLAVLLPVVILVVLATLILVAMRSCHNKRMAELHKKWGNWLGIDVGGERPNSDEVLAPLRAQAVGDSTLREFKDEMTSGSGSGMPHLVRRTLARQIRLSERIGKGRYGEVWKGHWNGDDVAVKIFFSRDEDSWKRETEIYSTVLLRHDNILGYIGSDCTSQNSCTQLWLVTHFYENGSLYDYMNASSSGFTANRSLRIISSSLNGLVHLHTEIFGTRGKPAIAHRDVKSKNILVRCDGSCVIADLGLAVMHSQKAPGKIDEQQSSRVGTRRYMSPEILNGSIESNKTFESYKRVDVYAFSLVVWEVLRRTRRVDGEPDSASDYRLPYHADVGPDPGFDEMRRAVCDERRRPEVPSGWLEGDPFFPAVVRLMRECWHENPTVRLSTLRMKKSLGALQAQLDDSRRRQRLDSPSSSASQLSSGYQSKASTSVSSCRNENVGGAAEAN